MLGFGGLPLEAMGALDVLIPAVTYNPISKLGGASTFSASPQRFDTLDTNPMLWDDDSQILWDDDTVVAWDLDL